MKKNLLIILISLQSVFVLQAQQFTEQTDISLTGVNGGSVAWGDYDNDGDLDILLTGNDNNAPISKIYKNNGDNSFTEQSSISLTGVLSSVDWGDYDNDGDLDILLAGEYSGWDAVTKIYKNNWDNSFSEQIGISLTGVRSASVTWGDYDNDGDLDILLCGNKNPGRIFKIYKNNGDNSFTEQTSISLTGIQSGSVDWGDYDNDGDLDIILAGEDGNGNPVSKIYKNNNDNSFSEQTGISSSGTDCSSVAWGDYDNDGDLDILLTGSDFSKIYKNNGDNSFSEQTDISLIGLGSGPSVAWGDYDNDGDLDIIITGSWTSKIYKNNGDNTFSEQTDISLTGFVETSVAWGDYDNDGDLDILLSGRDNNNDLLTKIYKNNSGIVNTKPESPSNLQSIVTGDKVILSWDKASDTETPQNGLSYNLYVSTTPAGFDICPPHSDINTGYRKIVEKGSIQGNSYFIKNLEAGTYYWNLQAIDPAYAGSEFATEGSFTISFTNSISPVDDQILQPSQNGNLLTVSETETADSRQWKYSHIPNGPYNNIIEGEASVTYTPNFTEFAAYYVVCVSTKDGISVTSNEVKIELPQFSEQTGISLTGIGSSSVAWGDYDDDGYLDILLLDAGISKIYKNNGDNSFTEQTGIISIDCEAGSSAWGDYDNDGDLDILLSGATGNFSNPISKIYKNNGDNTFTDQTGISLIGLNQSSVDWSDFDQDGDLDCILAGYDKNDEALTKFYWNVNNEFIEAGFNLRGGQILAIDDYNKDNYPDILIAGVDINGDKHTTLYKNTDNNTFSELTGIGLSVIHSGCVVWGDYNSDGYLDILLTGLNDRASWDAEPISKIYKNNGDNTFTEQTSISLTGVYNGSVAWGDYNNDGDLDILLTGDGFTKIYKNKGDNTITEQTGIFLTGVYGSSAAWGDYDNDGDLDILLTGNDNNGNPVYKIYKNNNLVINTEPKKPVNLQHETKGNQAKLYWDQANDTETPAQSLSYNVRVGTSPGASDIVSPMSLENGFKKIPGTGNTFLNNEFILNNLDTGTYYWSVQTVDNGFLASGFSEEKSFIILPTFTEQTGIVLTGVANSSVAWGDYDNDGYLDILLTGSSSESSISKIYKNNGDNSFIEQTGIILTGVTNSSVAWGDYNNDGYLDILLCGEDNNSDGVSKIYKNNGDNTFNEQSDIVLPKGGNGAWGDYDNDGDLDILITGRSEYDQPVPKIYKNNGNDSFTEQTDISLPEATNCYSWGDYDNDGDLDILLVSFGIFKIYKNNGDNTFTEQTGSSFPIANDVSIELGDYDNDGDLDVLLSGQDDNHDNILNIYRNDGNNVFTDINTDIRKVSQSSTVWGDYNNDGYLDILISGISGNKITKVYRNNKNGTFGEQIGISLPCVSWGSVAWGDYDNDGDLDILITGSDKSNNPISKIYRNNTNYPNHQPTSPENLQNVLSGFNMKLSWDKATDPDYPEGSLYYNLRIGTTPGATDIMPPMSDLTGGYRNLPAIGNAQCNTFWHIKNLVPGQTYYWSVQAIDQSFNGGIWATEQSFEIPNISAGFVADTVCAGSPTSFTDNSLPEGYITNWNWDFGDGNSSNLQNPTHTYVVAGEYVVDLTISSANYEHSISKNVVVKFGPLADFNIIQKGSLVCQFTNLTNTNAQTVTSWHWDFGDGNTYEEHTPELYDYSVDGIYTVSLTVETENECIDSISKTNLVCSSGLEVPEIYVRGPNVWYFASSNDSVENYRWYRNNVLIPDANQYIYVANQELGTYYFEINNGGDCWVPSEKITIPDDFYNGKAKKMEEAFDMQDNKTSTLVFPNPNIGKFTLIFDNVYIGKIYIRIKDVSGKTIRQYYSDKNQNVFLENMDLKKQGTGIYFIEIEYDGKNDVRKVVVE